MSDFRDAGGDAIDAAMAIDVDARPRTRL